MLKNPRHPVDYDVSFIKFEHESFEKIPLTHRTLGFCAY